MALCKKEIQRRRRLNQRRRIILDGSDDLYDYVIFLANMDGVDAQKSFTSQDSYARVATFNGNSQFDTDQAKFGDTSLLLFGGPNDHITFPDADELSLGNDSFTIECWIRWELIQTHTSFFVSKWTTGGGNEWAVGYDYAAGSYKLWVSSTGSDVIEKCVWANSPTLGEWIHIAATFDGTTYRLFHNGDLVDSDVSSTTLASTNSLLTIGDRADGTLEFDGWIDDVRITKGHARYTDDFDVPTKAFPTS